MSSSLGIPAVEVTTGDELSARMTIKPNALPPGNNAIQTGSNTLAPPGNNSVSSSPLKGCV